MIIRLIWTWCRTPVHFEGFKFEYKGTEVNFDIIKASSWGMAKAKLAKAKVEEGALTASLSKTRTRTRPDVPTPGGNPEPSGGQPNTGPTTRSQTRGQQEQGTKRANEDGHKSNACMSAWLANSRRRGSK